MIEGIAEESHSNFKYKGALMIVDYFQKSDTWQCVDAKLTIKGRGMTRLDAISDACNQWNEYLEK
jgi:hypothetical protein